MGGGRESRTRQPGNRTGDPQLRHVYLIVKCALTSGNRVFSDLRIADCVRADETATIQLLYSPEKSRFQAGFPLERAGLVAFSRV